MRHVRYSIRRKITTLLLGMVTVSVMLSGAVSLWGLLSMKRLSADSNSRLGQTAAEDAERALESLAVQNLQTTAKERAAYIEEKFKEVAAYVHGMAEAAENIYEHPEQYPDREVALPLKGSKTLAPQLLWSGELAKREGGGSPQADVVPPFTEEILKLGNMQDMLVQYNANNDMVSSVYIATKSGWTIQADYIAARKYQGGLETPDYFEAQKRQWFQRAVSAKEGQIVYSDVLRDINGGGNCIVCAEAVYAGGKPVAVAGVGSYLDTVNEAVLNTVIGATGYAFLIGKNGQILVSPKTEGETAATEIYTDIRESKNAGLAAVCAKLLSGDSGAEQITLDGTEVYLAYAPLENMGWGLVTVMDVEEVVAPASESQNRILLLAGEVSESQDETIRRIFVLLAGIMMAALSAICLSGAVFSKRLTDPVHTLANKVARMDGGNLDVPIRLKTGDEVEELANAFNKMAVKMKAYIGHLAEATAEKEHIRTELSLASSIQADMLPDSGCAVREWEEVSIYASMTPAKKVGGDFYDFFRIDTRHLAVLTADVSGKGVPAALFMVVAKTLLQSLVTESGTLAEAVSEVNQKLCGGNRNGMFVTAWIGVLDMCSGELTYVNAGHNPPLFGSREKGMEYVRESGGPILAVMEDAAYEQKTLRMSPGDTLFLYTDGVTETNDINGGLYGEERLSNLLQIGTWDSPAELAEAVHEDIRNFQGEAEQFDDITMLALHYKGNTERREEGPCEEAAADGHRNTGPAELSRYPSVRGFVEHFYARAGVSAKGRRKLLIALDEIFSNVCRYSNAGEVTVECRMESGMAVLVIEDDGMAFHPLERSQPDMSEHAEQREPGGLGIYMVRKMMDEAAYERVGGKNRLTIAVREQREANA